MYINAKMMPVETIPGIAGGIKESSGGVKSSHNVYPAEIIFSAQEIEAGGS
jgi:hypothetical protein